MNHIIITNDEMANDPKEQLPASW